MDAWHAFRNEFPAVGRRVYLNTAGGGAMSRAAAGAGVTYYEEHLNLGDAAWDTWLARMEEARSVVAGALGANGARLSFLQNASLAFNILARGLPTGSRVVAVDKEFPSCTTPFLRAGHEVRFLPTPPTGAVHASDLDAFLRAGADLFVLSSVQFANGFRADLKSLSAVCRAHGVQFAVDATQSVFAFPLHMEEDGVDWLVFSGYKWATAGYGIAVLASGSRAKPLPGGPPLTGWRSARHAHALENDRLDLVPEGVGHEMGHPLFPGIFALRAAVQLLTGVPGGTRAITERICALVSTVRTGALALGLRVRSWPDSDTSGSGIRMGESGIILLDAHNPGQAAARLADEGILVSARDGGLRISIHAYNDEEDVNALLDTLPDVL